MKSRVFLALAVATVGCSSGSTTEAPLPEGVTGSQRDALAALERKTADAWTWTRHDRFEHFASTRHGRAILPKNASVASATLALVDEHKALFGLRAPVAQLAVEKEERDELGMAHARFQQVTHGVPVVGAELSAHYDREGHLTSIDTTLVPGIDDLDLEPAIAADAVVASVASDVLARSTGLTPTDLEPSDPKLVVFALDGGAPRLAYEVTVRAIAGDSPAIWVRTVDAKTGATLDEYDNLQTIQGNAVGVLGDAKTVEVTQNGTSYVMTDTSGGVSIRTYTARTQQTVPGTQVTSNDVNSWDTGVAGAGAAVDAHVYAGVVFRYYCDKHGRNAIDGAGGAMISTAHFGSEYDNAFWDGRGMAYGDGGDVFRPLSAGLDVVAHEFTHGVTERTSQLRYQNQSGALNEAVSDIFGAFIEHAAKPDATKNWIVGEAVARNGGAVRDMATPSRGGQPAHMQQYRQTQQDNGGVHINSGIVNNAAWLMTVGGKNPISNVEVKYGIGWEKSEKLWYRANTRYFMSTTNFAGAAQGVLSAAQDLGFTDNEINIVDCAFKATGIAQGSCAAIVDPQSTAGAGEAPGGEEPAAESDAPGVVEEEGEEAPADEPPRRIRRIVTTESACSISTTGAAAATDTVALLLAALAGAALARRRKR